MKLFPAVDLLAGSAVRLIRGDYAQVTVYSSEPLSVAKRFRAYGAEFLHVVDLDGARDGGTPNFETVKSLIGAFGLQTEVGGGIRSRKVVEKYLEAGALRVILGTAAVNNPAFLREIVRAFGEKIAVGVDIKDGEAAVKGWTEKSGVAAPDFCRELEQIGVKTIICTDISKDGLLSGTNLELYHTLSQRLSLDLIASGGVSSLDDIRALREIGVYGAILGKALYEDTLDLAAAIQMAVPVREANA